MKLWVVSVQRSKSIALGQPSGLVVCSNPNYTLGESTLVVSVSMATNGLVVTYIILCVCADWSAPVPLHHAESRVWLQRLPGGEVQGARAGDTRQREAIARAVQVDVTKSFRCCCFFLRAIKSINIFQ